MNFGVGSSCGDNTQPAYVVDITGLKSVFTNSSYVVELIAASDSMISLTNALVIDATALTTNVVSYPSTPLPFDQGGTCGQWLRGHGGGISTVSTNFNTDHLQITSMYAGHGGTGAPPDGYDQAGTISGFIITDKPVVTMSAQPVIAGPGDSVTLNPYAIGVTPLSYQWLLNGTAVPNGTNSSLVISNLTAALAGSYVLTVTNIYGSATSAVTVVTEDSLSLTSGTNYVADTNPANAPRVGLDFGATWEATNFDGSLGRSGIMDFVATNADEITVAGTSNFDVPTGTITLWMRSAGTDPDATSTLGAALFGISTSNNGNDLILAQQPGGNLYFNAPFSSGSGTELASVGMVSDDKWHLIAVTFDQSDTGGISLYIDGVLDSTVGNAQAWTWPLGTAIQIGSSTDATWSPYDGSLDDIRFYNRQLTADELASIYSSNALVDTNALEMQLNFDAAPGTGYSLAWQMAGAILQSSPSLLGPYTDVAAATSPYGFTTKTGQNNFYRYRFTHQVLVSNPYLM